MFFIVFVALDGQNRADVVALEYLKVFFSFGIWSDEDIWSDLRELKLINAAFVDDDDVTSGVNDLSAARIAWILLIEPENSSWFSFWLKDVCFPQIVVIELLLKSEHFEGEGPKFKTTFGA